MSRELEMKILELQLRRLQQTNGTLKRGSDYVPPKKKSKPLGYKMQNTFEKNLRGVPGGSMARGVTAAVVKMIAAPETGCRVKKDEIGLLRSQKNANTTQGSYVTTIVK